jgi:hypothetical protein
VIYDISHVTTYSHDAAVASTRRGIRLTPRVAIGRDYADVSPIDDVFVGAGRQALCVSVDIKAVDAAQ